MQKAELGGEFKDESDPGIPQKYREINELIRLSQNKTGSVSRQRRDDALMDLCERFGKLIRKIAHEIYQPSNPVPFDEWLHDTTTTFIELVLDDYCLKEEGGSALFGHYIKLKLRFRMLDKAQRAANHSKRQVSIDPAKLLSHFNNGTPSRNSRTLTFTSDAHDGNKNATSDTQRLPTALYGAALANLYGEDTEDLIISHERGEVIGEEVREIMVIAKRVLKPRDFTIFTLHYASGMIAKEIAPLIDNAVTVPHIRYLAQQARQKVLEELGRQRVKRVLS